MPYFVGIQYRPRDMPADDLQRRRLRFQVMAAGSGDASGMRYPGGGRLTPRSVPAGSGCGGIAAAGLHWLVYPRPESVP
jgi:hypothetical protein